MTNMKTTIIALAAFAATTSETHAFRAGRNLHSALASTRFGHASRFAPARNRGSPIASLSRRPGPSALAMARSDATDEVVVMDKDFRLSAIFLALGLILDRIPYLQLFLGPLVTALGVLFLVQTFRVNFVCDGTTFSVQNASKEGDDAINENIVVGGENRWTYDSFVNYDFFPEGWVDQPQGPVLVYFKETQTPSGKTIHAIAHLALAFTYPS